MANLEISPPEGFESPAREPYATPEELISLFGEREIALLSTHADNGELDREQIEKAIEYAQSEVDSYLAGRYAVPLASPVPSVVMMVVGDIVRYRLTSGDVTEKDPITERYKLALKWLQNVANGMVDLPCKGSGDEGGRVFVDAGKRDW